MKLSTKGRYATRAMLDLALHFGEGPVLIKDVSAREEISELYLKQIFTPLRVGGLVRAFRGIHGGFILTRPPDQIKLSEIIEIVEGSTAPVGCIDDAKICSRTESCVTRDIWVEIKVAIDKILEFTTLQDLVERQRKKEQTKTEMYSI